MGLPKPQNVGAGWGDIARPWVTCRASASSPANTHLKYVISAREPQINSTLCISMMLGGILWKPAVV